jgi:hypothetical protein
MAMRNIVQIIMFSQLYFKKIIKEFGAAQLVFLFKKKSHRELRGQVALLRSRGIARGCERAPISMPLSAPTQLLLFGRGIYKNDDLMQ